MLLAMVTARIRCRLSSHVCPCYCGTGEQRRNACGNIVSLLNKRIVSTQCFVFRNLYTPGERNVPTTHMVPRCL